MSKSKVKQLFIELDNYLEKYGDDKIIYQHKLVKDTIDILNSEDRGIDNTVLNNYRSLFMGRSGLSEFYVWNNEYETRVKINRPFEKIKNELWCIMKQYF